MDILDNALATGRKFITEYESKRFLSRFGIPVVPEVLVSNLNDAKQAAQEIGYPVVLKGASPILIHKTEYNLVELNIRNYLDLENAYTRIMNNFTASCDQILVQKMIFGERELVVGLTRDFQFGPCVMFGVGGIFAELFRDTSFRLPPLTERDAMEMMDDIRGRNFLGSFRERFPADKESLSRILIAVGKIGVEYPSIKEMDINPLIVGHDGSLTAVDALIGLSPHG